VSEVTCYVSSWMFNFIRSVIFPIFLRNLFAVVDSTQTYDSSVTVTCLQPAVN